jgi:hypothetical protein
MSLKKRQTLGKWRDENLLQKPSTKSYVGNDYTAEIAEVKEPLIEITFTSFSSFTRGFPIPDWRQLEGTPNEKIKRTFWRTIKSESAKRIYSWLMDELVQKN